MLFEKIFQRDDKSFLLFYYSFLSIILFLSSNTSYYFRNNTWKFSESYFEATIFIVIIFFILSIFTTKEQRYIKGTVQWLRVEFLLLIQTFILVILVTVIFKTTDNYSRIWLFTNIVMSSFLFLFAKVLFDYIYAQLVKSNSIQRNILLIGDAESCQNIIKKLFVDSHRELFNMQEFPSGTVSINESYIESFIKTDDYFAIVNKKRNEINKNIIDFFISSDDLTSFRKIAKEKSLNVENHINIKLFHSY